MKITQEVIYKCDVYKCDNFVNKENAEKEIQVVRNTSLQTGYDCSPFLITRNLDICEDCMKKIFDGNYIYEFGEKEYIFKNYKNN